MYKWYNMHGHTYTSFLRLWVHVWACVRMCVRQPPSGGHGNTSFACLIMWLMVAPHSLTMWWRPGGDRGPSHWSCKPTTGIYHAYTVCVRVSVCVSAWVCGVYYVFLIWFSVVFTYSVTIGICVYTVRINCTTYTI